MMLIRFTQQLLLPLLLFGAVSSGCHRTSYVFRAAYGNLRATAPPAPARVVPAMLPPATARPTARRPSGPQFPVRLLARSRAPQLAARLKWAPPAVERAAGMSKEKKRQPAAYAPAQRSPTPEHRRSRGVAVLLAVVLGLFGAHLFYLGYRRRGLTYLLVTLASVGACFVAIPIAQTVQGNPFGGVIVGLAILLLGSAALIGVYLSSLLDAVHILTNDTQPRDGAYYPRSWQTRPELTDTKPQANPR